jgi:hypothetical protein
MGLSVKGESWNNAPALFLNLFIVVIPSGFIFIFDHSSILVEAKCTRRIISRLIL